MKHITITLLLILVVLGACRRNQEPAPEESIAYIPKGEKVIYFGPHTSCEGALLFQRIINKQFLRATNYPKAALSLKVGDTVFIEYQLVQTKNNDGLEYATPPVNISTIVQQPGHSTMPSNNGK